MGEGIRAPGDTLDTPLIYFIAYHDVILDNVSYFTKFIYNTGLKQSFN